MSGAGRRPEGGDRHVSEFRLSIGLLETPLTQDGIVRVTYEELQFTDFARCSTSRLRETRLLFSATKPVQHRATRNGFLIMFSRRGSRPVML
jgi:hypothetical protein